MNNFTGFETNYLKTLQKYAKGRCFFCLNDLPDKNKENHCWVHGRFCNISIVFLHLDARKKYHEEELKDIPERFMHVQKKIQEQTIGDFREIIERAFLMKVLFESNKIDKHIQLLFVDHNLLKKNKGVYNQILFVNAENEPAILTFLAIRHAFGDKIARMILKN